MILAFGGFDPTGGAGVLMDARAVDAAGGYAVAVPSCLAIQTTTSFDRIVPLPRIALERSLSCAAKSFPLSEDVEGLYFVGAGVHPGAGLPGVLSSAKVLERVVPQPARAPGLLPAPKAVTA